ncbi:hypothetical protein ATANTOWER_028673 [Ataeniobius toweri]|uniref:Uncharacterized protein n=1 Tax=Ataeniobius toweri TaxID=208326 RepID=A0ABU7BB81_9TELE|nr:hypothetical protein [Ataeniobius toweri]
MLCVQMHALCGFAQHVITNTSKAFLVDCRENIINLCCLASQLVQKGVLLRDYSYCCWPLGAGRYNCILVLLDFIGGFVCSQGFVLTQFDPCKQRGQTAAEQQNVINMLVNLLSEFGTTRYEKDCAVFSICMLFIELTSFHSYVLEGDTGVDFLSCPIPLPQKNVLSHPNPRPA